MAGNEDDGLRHGHAADVAGKRADCDGGGPVVGSKYAGRQEFTGTLTGEFVDQGDPPWRWYLMCELTRKPDNYPNDAVWCESDSVFLLDDPNRLLGPAAERAAETAADTRADNAADEKTSEAEQGE